MPSITNNLALTNLTYRNYNSLELFLWDTAPVAGATLSNLNVTQTGTSVTVNWGDNKTNNSTQKSYTVNHTY